MEVMLRLYGLRGSVCLRRLMAASLLVCASLAVEGQTAAGAATPGPEQTDHSMPREDGASDGLEILSDTQGVDFKAYVKGVLRSVYTAWLTHLPAEAKPPTSAKGITVIRFTVGKDGHVLAMHLDGSTHDEELNRAAWAAIAGAAQFPHLPEEFHGPSLELRIHFRVNEDAKEKALAPIPEASR